MASDLLVPHHQNSLAPTQQHQQPQNTWSTHQTPSPFLHQWAAQPLKRKFLFITRLWQLNHIHHWPLVASQLTWKPTSAPNKPPNAQRTPEFHRFWSNTWLRHLTNGSIKKQWQMHTLLKVGGKAEAVPSYPQRIHQATHIRPTHANASCASFSPDKFTNCSSIEHKHLRKKENIKNEQGIYRLIATSMVYDVEGLTEPFLAVNSTRNASTNLQYVSIFGSKRIANHTTNAFTWDSLMHSRNKIQQVPFAVSIPNLSETIDRLVTQGLQPWAYRAFCNSSTGVSVISKAH